MISGKGKRKLQFEGTTYFWWIKKDASGHPRIYVISEDKRVYFERSFDKEIGIGTGYIESLLRVHEEQEIK